jgi:hypothetical protein
MRGSRSMRGSHAKQHGYRSRRNDTPSCWVNFSRCPAYMAILYQTLIWLRLPWNTGLRCAPPMVILHGFAGCAGLIPSRPKDEECRHLIVVHRKAAFPAWLIFSMNSTGWSPSSSASPSVISCGALPQRLAMSSQFEIEEIASRCRPPQFAPIALATVSIRTLFSTKKCHVLTALERNCASSALDYLCSWRLNTAAVDQKIDAECSKSLSENIRRDYKVFGA